MDNKYCRKHVTEITAVYRDCLYVVKFLETGHRCGYVRVGDPAVFEKLRKQYGEELSTDISCHGGITFVETVPENDEYLPEGNWVGFDCAHAGDSFDFELVEKIWGKENAAYYRKFYHFMSGSIKSREYVENECRNIIDQIIEMGKTI